MNKSNMNNSTPQEESITVSHTITANGKIAVGDNMSYNGVRGPAIVEIDSQEEDVRGDWEKEFWAINGEMFQNADSGNTSLNWKKNWLKLHDLIKKEIEQTRTQCREEVKKVVEGMIEEIKPIMFEPNPINTKLAVHEQTLTAGRNQALTDLLATLSTGEK